LLQLQTQGNPFVNAARNLLFNFSNSRYSWPAGWSIIPDTQSSSYSYLSNLRWTLL